MGFCEHRAAEIMAEFDDARAEKLKNKQTNKQTSTIKIFFNFSQNVDNRQRKLSMVNLNVFYKIYNMF